MMSPRQTSGRDSLLLDSPISFDDCIEAFKLASRQQPTFYGLVATVDAEVVTAAVLKQDQQ